MWAAILVALLSTVAVSTAQAQSSSGTIDAIISDQTTAIAVAMANDQTVYALDQQIVVTARSGGQDLMHQMTGHCVSHEVVTNSTGDSVTNGYCEYIDKDKDKIFERVVDVVRSGGAFVEGKGKGMITGGTGKFAGISGEVVHSRLLLVAHEDFSQLVEGVFPGVGILKGEYTIE